jgi:hypothetical protein
VVQCSGLGVLECSPLSGCVILDWCAIWRETPRGSSCWQWVVKSIGRNDSGAFAMSSVMLISNHYVQAAGAPWLLSKSNSKSRSESQISPDRCERVRLPSAIAHASSKLAGLPCVASAPLPRLAHAPTQTQTPHPHTLYPIVVRQLRRLTRGRLC